jgi:hypothetical protein
MSHAFLFVPAAGSAADSPTFKSGVQALCRFKSVQVTDTVTSDFACLTVAPGSRVAGKRIGRSADGQVWIVDLGTWLPLPAIPRRDIGWLVDQYVARGARELARDLQGLFALLIVDLRSRCVHVVTDRCGSLHVFFRKLANGYVVSTSSAALALCGAARFDPVAVHEFIGTGIVYEDRSLWLDVMKVGPATVLTLDGNTAQSQAYWQFADVRTESLGLDEAVEATYHGLVEVLKALPIASQPLMSDLTGGYDSRFLLAGLLEAGRPFMTTVSGSQGHPDVTVAARIASELSLPHQHVVSQLVPTGEEFDAALRMTDGEYDAFDYARILSTHRQLSAEHCMSLNGSFGELARGYWWELLWPNLAKSAPLDTAMVARRRFAAIRYDKSIFNSSGQLDLPAHMAEVAQRAVAPVVGFPNTSQMDCVYYTLRMQRWQGRIASATNQLWPALSPIGFAQVLDPILAAKASTRFRSLLVRELFVRFSPVLARIPLEHGYPPTPATPFNLWRFAPLLDHYGGKILSKAAGRLMRTGSQSSAASPAPTQAQRQENANLFRDTDIREWLKTPLLGATGLFHEDALHRMIDPNGSAGGANVDQWRRLVTLESLLRKIG